MQEEHSSVERRWWSICQQGLPQACNQKRGSPHVNTRVSETDPTACGGTSAGVVPTDTFEPNKQQQQILSPDGMRWYICQQVCVRSPATDTYLRRSNDYLGRRGDSSLFLLCWPTASACCASLKVGAADPLCMEKPLSSTSRSL